MMEKDGTQMTKYGALIPKDGVSLMEKLMKLEKQQVQEQVQKQTNAPKMQMGGIS